MDDRPQTTYNRRENSSPHATIEEKLAVGGRPSAVVVAVVGPCASGKSSLVVALRKAGYVARQPAQEHSYVQDMWRRLVDPDVLIYLDLSHEAYRRRRPKDDAGPEYLAMQRERLAHAREHADLVIDTSELSTEAVWARVMDLLEAK